VVDPRRDRRVRRRRRSRRGRRVTAGKHAAVLGRARGWFIRARASHVDSSHARPATRP
jgi:hypothetical protein